MADDEALVAECEKALEPYEDPVLLAALKRVLDARPGVVQELADWAVPDKAYASTRILLEGRLTGSIRAFKEEQGFGFISCPEVQAAFGADVFVHSSQFNGFTVGSEVSFALLLNKDRKPQAFDIGPPTFVKGGGKGGKGSDGASWDGGKGGKGGKGGAWDGGGKGGKGGKDPWAGKAWAGGWDEWSGWGKGYDEWSGWGKGGKDPWGKGKDPWGGWGKGPGKGGPMKGGGKSTGEAPASAIEMEGITDRRFDGLIKAFYPEKGYGFIECEEIKAHFGGDVFLHSKQIEGFESGSAVSFAVFLNKDGKPQAKELGELGGEPVAKKPKVEEAAW